MANAVQNNNFNNQAAYANGGALLTEKNDYNVLLQQLQLQQWQQQQQQQNQQFAQNGNNQLLTGPSLFLGAADKQDQLNPVYQGLTGAGIATGLPTGTQEYNPYLFSYKLQQRRRKR